MARKSVFANMSESNRHRFVGGRAAHNRRRQIAAERRRARVVELFADADLTVRGWRSRIAETIGCHRSTVCRDLQFIAATMPAVIREKIDREIEHSLRFIRQMERVDAKREADEFKRQYASNEK